MNPVAASVRAAILSGIAGLVTISVYLSIALPLFFKTPPLLLFQWDDSNIVGPSAYLGGWNSAAWGLFYDCLVALCWAACYVIAYRTFPIVRRATVASGLLFGLIVWLVMFFVVVPLGRADHASTLPQTLDAIVAHTLFFGLPIALVVRGNLRLFELP